MTEPTDAEIVALADATRTAEGGASGYILPISFARAVLARWGAQDVPASQGYALVPVEPTPEMVDAAQEAYMPFGDMQLAIQLAIAAAPQPVAWEPLSAEQYNILVEDLSEWSRHVEDIAPQSLKEHIHQVFAIHGIKPSPQADSQPAPQGETNAHLDTDSNSSAPGQQRDVAGTVALGQSVGHGSDSTAGDPSAQGDKLLTVAERNIRSFLRSATFKSESDREAALNCVDVLWAAARAPADSVLEDAERYRWLRQEHERVDPVCHLTWKRNLQRDSSEWVNTAVLDTAIDSARKQGGAT